MERHPFFVKPAPLTLGYRDELRHDKYSTVPVTTVKRIPNLAYYVSVENTVKALLSNSFFLEQVLHEKPIEGEGVIHAFQDGSKYSELLNTFPFIITLQFF